MWTLSQVGQATKAGLWANAPTVVEYLVVAGGGGGGGGGGGAGGLLQGLTGISVGTSYTVTVGAGATQTQIVVGGANTSIVTSNSIAINGDLILNGQVGVGTTSLV